MNMFCSHTPHFKWIRAVEALFLSLADNYWWFSRSLRSSKKLENEGPKEDEEEEEEEEEDKEEDKEEEEEEEEDYVKDLYINEVQLFL